MDINLDRDEVEALRELLRYRIVSLDKEINRTDSFAFKHELQKLDRVLEHIVVKLSNALENHDI
jgi:hypothetical protein